MLWKWEPEDTAVTDLQDFRDGTIRSRIENIGAYCLNGVQRQIDNIWREQENVQKEKERDLTDSKKKEMLHLEIKTQLK